MHIFLTSSQDGSVDKHGSPPHTTIVKIQLNYKTTITQKYQKIELYGHLTTKELKKALFFMQVGGMEMWRCEDMK